MFQLNKDKYIRILKAEGINTALTALHKDTERGELDSFEGGDGWKSAQWDKLAEARIFSRELWERYLKGEFKQESA